MRNILLLLVLLLTPSVSFAETEKSQPICNNFEECFPLAEKGNYEAKLRLSNYYAFGVRGAEKDEVKSFELQKELAEESYPLGQTHFASLYLHGRGVEKDVPKAIIWFEKAADQGELQAMTYLGSIYYSPEYPHNIKKASYYWLKAAELGHSNAQWLLGKWFADGHSLDEYNKHHNRYLVSAYAWMKISYERLDLNTPHSNSFTREFEIFSKRLDGKMLNKADMLASSYFNKYVKPFE